MTAPAPPPSPASGATFAGPSGDPSGAPSGGPSTRRRYHRLQLAAVVLALGVISLGSVTFLGGAASSKFSGVGSAIGGGGGAPSGGGAVRASTATTNGGSPVLTAPFAASAASSSPSPAPPSAAPSLDAVALPLPATAGRTFISTATMTVHAADLGAAKQKAILAVEGKGGGLFGEASSFDGDGKATLTFKVPPEHFRTTLTELEGMGTLVSQEVKTDDVTQQLIDLDARIVAASASLDRTRLLLDKADSLAEISTLDGEVARRQADLESLRGQQRTLSERTALATIVLTFVSRAPARIAAASASPSTSSTSTTTTALPGFRDGLGTGWKAFTEGGSVFLAVVGVLLPFMIVVGPVALALAVRARLRRRRGVPGASPAPATA